MTNDKGVIISKRLIGTFVNYINIITEASEYDWKDEFKLKTLKDTRKAAINSFREIIDPANMTITELMAIGFQRWHVEETDEYLLLLPMYMYNVLKEGTEVISIFGERKIIGKDYIDNDDRCGCLAYGFLMEKYGDKVIVNMKEI